jgi:RimJ/RimL family protein N-acetyltransferase
VWKWANENSVRTVSFSDAFIPWEEHVRWFEERINRPYFYIALNQDDRPVGQIRFDQIQGETFISVMIDSHFRNWGYGAALIRLGCEKVFFSSDITAIHAYMKPDNEASRMAFVKAGFKELPKTVYQGHPAYHCILSRY